MKRCERRTTQVAELNKRWTPETPLLVDRQVNLHSDQVKWSCACRILESAGYKVQECGSSDPTVGDVELVKVEDVGHQSGVVNLHNEQMRVYADDSSQGVFGNRYARDPMLSEVAHTSKSVEVHGGEYQSRSLVASLFRVIGFGLGIAGLCVTALTLVLAPVLVVEPNQWIRDLELFWIGVGLAALVAELFVTKR